MDKFTPIEYLKIDVATHFGLDKANWTERLKWTADHQQEIYFMLDQVNEGLTSDLIRMAEEPALFYAASLALREAYKGNPVSHPISLDATASGAQLMAAVMRCKASAVLCNVTDASDPEDFYTAIYEHVVKLMEDAGYTVSGFHREELKDAINY
jgi:DNA-directed RNA polymerase